MSDVIEHTEAVPTGASDAHSVQALQQSSATSSWTALIVGSPGDGTMLLVDWLMMACAHIGLVARAIPIASHPSRPHGMIVEVASSSDELDNMPAVPADAVDVVIAGEHLELARVMAAGWIAAERTVVVASCVRTYSQMERSVAPEHVVRESEIDAVIRDAARHYVAFDGAQVAGWYSLPARVQPGLLLGALVGSAATPITLDAARTAVARLGIDADMHLQAIRRGVRLGKRQGGRVQRTLTAQQFIRKRRGSLDRSQRAGFEMLINRVENAFDSSLHAQLREGVVRLVEYQDCIHASAYLDRCAYVLGSGEVADDIALTFVRNLAHLMIHPDPAFAAEVKLRRGRVPSVRRALGISRSEPFSIKDVLLIERDERPVGRIARMRGTQTATRGTLLASAPQLIAVDLTTVRGARRLRRIARQRARRRDSQRFEQEMATVDAYVGCMHDVVVSSPALMRIVAESGSIVQGGGAMRRATAEAGHAFWGRIVRQAVTIDRASSAADTSIAAIVVPHVWKHMCETGSLALWEYCGGVVGIAMQHSRGADHDQLVAWAKTLCTEGPSR